MDTGRMWNFGLEEQGPLTEIKVSGIDFDIGRISNDVTKAMLLMAELKEATKLFKAVGLFQGKRGEKYVGLTKDSNNIIKMSYDIENKIMESATRAAPTNDNMFRFLSDYCKVGRMRQELTIDYAKKLTDLSGITSLLTDDVVALGLKNHRIAYDTSKQAITMDIARPQDFVKNHGKIKIVFEDPIHESQQDCMRFVQRKVEGAGGILEWLQNYRENSDDQRWDALCEAIDNEIQQKEYSIFLYAKNIYKDTVGGILSREDRVSEEPLYAVEEEEFYESDIEFNDIVRRIENMVRLATRDMTPIERAQKLKACARGRKTFEAKEETENKLYLQICKEEYLLFLVSMGYADVPFIGERLYDESPEGYEYLEGETLSFIDGEVAGAYFKDAFIEIPYTGELTVYKKDGVLYAGKPIEEAIKVPEPEMKFTFRLDSKAVAGHAREMFDLLSHRDNNNCAITVVEVSGKDQPMMCIRIAGEKEFIPVYIHNSLMSHIRGKKGTIVGTRLNTVKSSNGLSIPTIYIDVDYID